MFWTHARSGSDERVAGMWTVAPPMTGTLLHGVHKVVGEVAPSSWTPLHLREESTCQERNRVRFCMLPRCRRTEEADGQRKCAFSETQVSPSSRKFEVGVLVFQAFDHGVTTTSAIWKFGERERANKGDEGKDEDESDRFFANEANGNFGKAERRDSEGEKSWE